MGSDYAGKTWAPPMPLAHGFRAAAGDTAAMTGMGTYTDAPDADLVAWSARGDRRAFDEIVARHGSFALRVALRLIPDPHSAEDVVQEAMLRAWSQSHRFDPRRARFTTWLYRIVVNLCIDQSRRMRYEPLPDTFDCIDPSAGADEILEASEQRGALAAAMNALPIRQRAVVILVYDEGLSGAEAGRILDLSAKAVERLLARARAALRDRLRAGCDVKGMTK